MYASLPSLLCIPSSAVSNCSMVMGLEQWQAKIVLLRWLHMDYTFPHHVYALWPSCTGKSPPSPSTLVTWNYSTQLWGRKKVGYRLQFMFMIVPEPVIFCEYCKIIKISQFLTPRHQFDPFDCLLATNVASVLWRHPNPPSFIMIRKCAGYVHRITHPSCNSSPVNRLSK